MNTYYYNHMLRRAKLTLNQKKRKEFYFKIQKL